MAPEPPSSPDVIDFKFSIVGDGFLQAATQLANQMSQLQTHLQQFGGAAPEQVAAAMLQSGGRQIGGVYEGGHPHRSIAPIPTELHQTESGPSTPPDADHDPGQMPEPGTFAYDLWRRRTGLDRYISNLPPDAEPTEPRSRQAGLRPFAQDLAEAGQPSEHASVPPTQSLLEELTGENFFRRVQTLHGAAAGHGMAGYALQAAQAAALPWAQRLGIGQNWLQQLGGQPGAPAAAAGGGAVPPPGGGGIMGAILGGGGGAGGGSYWANLLRMSAASLIPTGLLHRDMMRMGADREVVNPSGSYLGFERGPMVSIPGTEIGFQLPGAATWEGLRQRWTANRLRMRAGISGGQANEIVSSIAQNGFSGGEANNLAYNYISDLVRQGQDPQTATSMFTQAIRNGNASMDEVSQTLQHLGEAAQAARQPLSDYMEGLNQFSEQAQSAGATKAGGLELGASFTRATGLSGQQGTELFQSPIMQGMMMRNYGLLPNDMASLSRTAAGREAFTQTFLQTVDMAMRLAAPFNQPVTDAQGRVIESGRDRQIAQAANFAGVSQETFRRMLNNEGQTRHFTQVQADLEQYRSAVGQHDGVRIVPGRTQPGDWIPARQGIPGAELHQGQWMMRATVPGAAGHIEISRATQGESRQWNAIESELRAAAPQGAGRQDYLRQVADIGRLEDPQERIRKAENLISAAQKRASEAPEDNKTVYVKFTGKAAQYFEQDKASESPANRTANAGGQPRNRSAAGYDPNLPAPPGFGP